MFALQTPEHGAGVQQRGPRGDPAANPERPDEGREELARAGAGRRRGCRGALIYAISYSWARASKSSFSDQGADADLGAGAAAFCVEPALAAAEYAAMRRSLSPGLAPGALGGGL